MFDISTKAAAETFDVPINDPATGEPVIGEGGQACSVTVYGPGTRQYAAAQSAANNKAIKRLRSKGKTDTTPEEDEAAKASFLSAITVSFNAFSYKGMPDERETFRALYADRSLGWITDQVNAGAGDWANFSKGSSES